MTLRRMGIGAHVRPIIIAVGLASAMAACVGPPGAVPPQEVAKPAGPTGRIRGVVTLLGQPPTPQLAPNAKDTGVCQQSVSLVRLSLGKDRAVQHAFVYLDGVPSTSDVRPRAHTQIEQKGCEYGPRAVTIPTSADLEIVNSDPILHNVHAREATPDGRRTIFNIAQPIRGQRTKVEAPLTRPGIIELTCEAGHPWMTAYILVAGHPFVATTNGSGEFLIDNVPAGTYQLRMWHEGVRLTRMIPSLQQYEYEAPYEATQTVNVPADGEAVVNFSLALRPSA